MGSSCSHINFYTLNTDPQTYTDKLGIWKFRVSDAKCNECQTIGLRAIKKTCLDHMIEQPWEIMDKISCQHELMKIKNKTKDNKNNKYTARAECICCLSSVPVHMRDENYLDIGLNKGIEENIQNPGWVVDKIKNNKEIKEIKEKKNLKMTSCEL